MKTLLFTALLSLSIQARAEVVKLHVLKFVHVEKEILFLTFDRDETEALVCKTGDCSFLHGCLYDVANADLQSV